MCLATPPLFETAFISFGASALEKLTNESDDGRWWRPAPPLLGEVVGDPDSVNAAEERREEADAEAEEAAAEARRPCLAAGEGRVGVPGRGGG